MPQAVTVTPEERQAIERVSLSSLVLIEHLIIYVSLSDAPKL